MQVEEQGEPSLIPPQSLECHISQVPNEILAKVFTAGTEEWRDLDPQGFPFPYLVSGVCKYWNILSHSTPALWTFIMPPLHHTEESLSWTAKWAQRSKAMAISVVLDDTVASPKSEWGVTSQVNLERLVIRTLDLLTQQCDQRLYRIDLRLKIITSNIIRSLATLSTSNDQVLKQISICSHSGHYRYVGFSPSAGKLLSWLQTLPNLTKFRFQCSSFWPVTMPGMGNSLSLPYISNLVSLDLSHLRPTHSDIQALFATPNSSSRLTHLVLRHLYPIQSPAPDGWTPIHVDPLRSVAVSTAERTRGIQEGVSLFTLLVIPNLTYLEINSATHISALFGNSLSHSKIDTLKIINRLPLSLPQHFPDRYKEDMRIFRSFSNLQKLSLIRLGVSASLLLRDPGGSQDTASLTRKRSINFQQRVQRERGLAFFQQPSGSTMSSTDGRLSIVWPSLRSVTIDTMFAEDVKSLLDFIKRHQSVLSVHLSASAMRNLSSLRRKGDEIMLPVPGVYKFRNGMVDATGEGVTDDVPEWLRAQVRLSFGRIMDESLLERDGAGLPLSEML